MGLSRSGAYRHEEAEVPIPRARMLASAYRLATLVVVPQRRAEPKNQMRSFTMRPPNAPLTSYTRRTAFTDVRPWLCRSAVGFLLLRPPPGPPKKPEPQKGVPPPFGIMFPFAPPYSYCAQPREPLSLS